MMTHLKDTVFVLPNVILEFYGSIDDTLIDSAAQKHSQFIEQKTPLLVQANKVVQNSLQHYYYKSTDALIHSIKYFSVIQFWPKKSTSGPKNYPNSGKRDSPK